ncbi:MAG: hypothetical protein H0W75_08135, partial [Chitinophagaceae bacterium]|nr:hypothetical protein [Chitinophagaceae bacterium]
MPIFCCLSSLLYAKDTSKLDKLINLPDKLFASIDKKTRGIEDKLNKQTDKYISRLQRQEKKLQKKLWRNDSTLAKQLFLRVGERYTDLKTTLTGTAGNSNVYLGHLDSLSTALSFIKSTKLPGELNGIEKNLQGFKDLQTKFNQSERVKKYLEERQRVLKESFQNLGMVKELKKFRKEVYYYQAQVQEYKNIFEEPGKLEKKLLELVTKIPA